jgi:hypothetical protein
VSAIWTDFVEAPIESACGLLVPSASLSVKACGGVWQVSSAPIEFITACSWLLSVSG